MAYHGPEPGDVYIAANLFLNRYVYNVVKNRRAHRWYGHSGSSTQVRRYVCYICRKLIATDSAKWMPTVHADKAVEAHKVEHLRELAPAPKKAVAPGQSIFWRGDGFYHVVKDAFHDQGIWSVSLTQCGKYVTGVGSNKSVTCMACLAA